MRKLICAGLGVLALGCLVGEVIAQYNPYYPPMMPQPGPMYYQPVSYQPQQPVIQVQMPPTVVQVQAAAPADPGAKAPEAAPAPAMAHAPVVAHGDACDNCNGGSSWHMTAEAGVYILKPIWTHNPAFYLSNSGTLQNNSIQNFDYSYSGAPRAALGVENQSGMGFRVSFWKLSDDVTILGGQSDGTLQLQMPLGIGTDSIDSPGEYRVTSRLEMVVWDFEATQRITTDNWVLTASGGVRYAHISQEYDGISTEDADLFVDAGTVHNQLSTHNFNGAGPTIALEGARRVGSSNLFLYGQGRGTVLFGQGKQEAFYASYSAFPSLNSVYQQTEEYDLVIPVGEVEVGGRWERDWGRMRVFLQAGLVGQGWVGAGNSTRTSHHFNSTGSLGSNGGDTIMDDLGLVGISAKGGIRY